MALENLSSTDEKSCMEISEDSNDTYSSKDKNNHNKYNTSSLCDILKVDDSKNSSAIFESISTGYNKTNLLSPSENSPYSTDSESNFIIESECTGRQQKIEPTIQKLYNSNECNNNCNYGFVASENKHRVLEASKPKEGSFEAEYSKYLFPTLSSDNFVAPKLFNATKRSSEETYLSRSDIPTQTEPRINLILPPKKRIRDTYMYTDVKKQRLQSPELESKEEKNTNIVDRCIKPPCKCVYKCYSKMDFNQRVLIFQKFSKITDIQEQMDFLLQHTEKFKKVSCNIRNVSSNHLFTFKYKLPLVSKDIAVPVCKKMFLNTLMVNDKLIKAAWENLESGKEFIQNQRGRRKKHKKIVVKTMVKSVRDHVNSFTPVDSPYSGENISKLYLDGTLSISRMFHLYNEWIDPNKYIRRAKTERQYKELVKKNLEIDYRVSNNNEYKLSNDYVVPKSDTLNTQNVTQSNNTITNDDNIVNTYNNYCPLVPCLTDSKDHFCKEHDQLSTGDNPFDADVITEPLNNYSKYHNHSATSAVINCNCIKTPSENIPTIPSNTISSLQQLTTLTENTPKLSDIPLPSSKLQENGTKNEINNTLFSPEKNKDKKGVKNLDKQRNIPVKVMGPPCECINKCSNKLSESERKSAYQTFQDLGDKQKQIDFILKHTEKNKKKRCVTRKPPNNRLYTFTYKLPNSRGALIKICKRMFLNTLVVSDGTVRGAWEKREERKKDNIPKIQKISARKVAKSIIKSVRDHVNSFVPVESHFLGKQSNKLYLDGSLDISRMFQLYNIWFDPNKYIRKARSEKKYKQIIEKHFNLDFHQSKKEECDQCQSFRKLTKPNDEQIGRHIIHTQNNLTTYNKKNQDKLDASFSNGKILTAVFDIEKLLPCPNGQETHFNNKRKLFCFNLPILNIITKRPVCYMWDERYAKNGANEVGSCLFDFLNFNIDNGVREFRFWSKNDESRNIVIFCVYIAVAIKNKVNIYHNFQVKDHGQNEMTSVHSVIEKVSSTKHIFTPEEWKHLVNCIRTSSQEPFKVVEMTQDDFYNFESHVNYCNWQKDIEGKTVSWNDVREIFISSDDPCRIQFKYDFNQDYEIIDLKRQIEFPEIIKAYNKILPLSEAKYNDLISLCDNGFIPKEYIEYYKYLPYVGQN